MNLSLTPANLFIRGVIIYFFVLMLIRISGKKQMGQMSAAEFVALLLISNAVQNSMNGGDNSLVGGLILAATLIFASWLISHLTYKSKRISRVLEGVPTILIHKGHVVMKNLEKERITINELHTLLRKQQMHHFSDIHSAILEVDGTLSLTKMGEENLKPKLLEGDVNI